MRSLAQAALYPGVGLHETAVSVGRGTDTPFEVLGAPYIDGVQLASALNRMGIRGVRFIPIRFTPDASVFKGEACEGVNMVVTDRDRFQSVELGVALALTLQRMYPGQYALGKVDTLLRDNAVLESVKAGRTWVEIRSSWEVDLDAFRKRRAQFLLY